MNVPVVNGHEYVLVTVHRFDGESARQIGRGPLVLGTGVRETGEGFVIRVGGRGGIGKGSGVDGGVEQGREAGRGGSCEWTRHLVARCRGARMPWLGREGETCGQWYGLVGGSRGYIHGRGRGEKWRERGNRNCDGGRPRIEQRAEKRERREQC